MNFEDKINEKSNTPIEKKGTILEGNQEKIMESHRKDRLEILKTFSAKLEKQTIGRLPKPMQNLVSVALNYAGVVGLVKMLAEASAGQTMTGEKLSPKDRIMYVLIQGTNIAAYSLLFAGDLKGFGYFYGTSWVLNEIQQWPVIVKNLKLLCEKYDLPALNKFLDKTNALIEKCDAQKILEKSLKGINRVAENFKGSPKNETFDFKYDLDKQSGI